ncbi:MAG: VWA domain-containing protein [Desulfobacterales bacterium]|nr:VWA domain-containing protein [Desulfobacterales bacterium]
MKFSDTHLLFLLWGLVPLAGILVFGIRRHKKVLSGFADTGMFTHILPGLSYTRRWVKAGLILAGFSLAVTAAAGPRAGFRWEKTTQKGVDIMIALDCSRSMLAQDVSPTRLERAKREIIDLTRLLHSDRAGLVAFAGRAVLQCPLTLDYQAFGVFLDALDPDYLPVGGTDLVSAIQTCVKGFDPESDTEKAIIVITDGEDTAGRGDNGLTEITQMLVKEKIRLFTIGVGDPAGAPIPDPAGGFKKDDQGNIILSKVDEETLKKISAATSGRYVRSVAGDMDLEQIYTNDILATMDRKQLTQGRKKVWEHRFQWALLPALLLLLAALMLPDHKRNKGNRSHSGLLTVLAVLSGLTAGEVLLPSQARAELLSSSVKQGIEAYSNQEFQKAKKHFIDAQLDSPEDPRHYYNIGTAAYAAGEYELAENNFTQAALSGDRDLRHNALFNLANTRYRRGRLDQAVKDYEALVKEYPEDTQARENLDFLKQKQKEEKERQSRKDQSQSQSKDQEGQQDQGGRENKGREKDGEQNQDKNGQSRKDKGAGQDSGNKNQDQQDPPGQEKKDPDDQPRQDKGVQGRNDENIPEPGEDASGETGPEAENDRGMAGSSGKDRKPLSDAEEKMLENRLNRLADKPGMALMPGGSTNVEKDW